MNLLEEFLKKNGPCLSSDLVQELVDKHNLSYAAARKRVSRTGKNIHRLEGLPLPRNVKFIYLKKDYRSPFFWSALYKAFKDTNSAYWYAIAALKERDGIMPYDHFLIACGSPFRQQKHIPPEKILERLEMHEILSIKNIDGFGRCIILTQCEQELQFILLDLRARLVVEKLLISAVSQWARNLGLVSYNIFKDRDGDELPVVSTTLWDMAGPSYISPLVERGKDENSKLKPGFFACDILLNKKISEDGIQPFLRKCRTLRGLPKVGRCMQMFVANDYHPEAFQQAKVAGILPATVETLFGKDVAKGLTNLLQTLENAARAIIIEPERFNTLFDQLGKIEGAVGNLRGVLFEYFSATVVDKAYRTFNVRMNEIYKTSDGLSAESDIVAELNTGTILFIECKGHQPNGTVSHDEVKRWLHTRVPTLRKYALEHPEWKRKKLSFSLWTTGSFTDESLALLTQAKSGTGKYELDFLDAEGLLEVVKSCNDKEMLRTYFKCFLDYPLKKLEKEWLTLPIKRALVT
ncbi:hypothetical protein PE36_07332 [Moritella sp. PE36]|uniref:hypothetical protein n=1 Tax=Moritella sp. PE36 TaxID=58051 RepID=UPI00015689C2|nr:hypothetical protein [Moritella sp. PE36]EDM69281.1 hypothetical protein PE36_07332 [Moritella sp. PE36]